MSIATVLSIAALGECDGYRATYRCKPPYLGRYALITVTSTAAGYIVSVYSGIRVTVVATGDEIDIIAPLAKEGYEFALDKPILGTDAEVIFDQQIEGYL